MKTQVTGNLASFRTVYTATNLLLRDVQYLDTDGDGQDDLLEIAAGTNPQGPTSLFRVFPPTRNASGHPVIMFSSVNGKNYRIEFSSDLATWTPVAGSPIAATSEVASWVDDGTLTGGLPGTSRFYRAPVVP